MQPSFVTPEDALLTYDPWAVQQAAEAVRATIWLDGLQIILLLMIVMYLMALSIGRIRQEEDLFGYDDRSGETLQD